MNDKLPVSNEQLDAIAEYSDFAPRTPAQWRIVEQEAARHADYLKKLFPEGKFPTVLGGPGSGNYGHAGRPGQTGGSAPDVGPDELTPKSMDDPKAPRWNRTYTKKPGDKEYVRDGFTMIHTPGNIEESWDNTITVINEQNKIIGSMQFGAHDLKSTGKNKLQADVDVHPEFRRRGMATAMYDLAESITKRKFAPAVSQSARGEAFWKNRLGKVGKKHERMLGGPGSGNFGHAGRPGQLGGSASDSGGYAAFESQALENLKGSSRTAGGVSDTSSSDDKPKLNVEGEALAQKTEENFKGALKIVWEERNRDFRSPEEVRKFTEEIAGQVSKGLLQPGQPLYRTWETKNRQASPEAIQERMQEFSASLHERLQTKDDPVGTAAWIEKELSYIHPWADGVGRTTKALSAFALARGGKKLPTYPGRKEYYTNIDKMDAKEWDSYFRTFFKK